MKYRDRPLLAIPLRIAGALFLATMLMLVKYAGESGLSTPEIIFWRNAISLPIISVWLFATGGFGRLRTNRIGAYTARSVVGTVAMAANFGAAIMLPLAEATTISFTAPLFAVLITAIILRDRVGPMRWSAVCIGLTGVAIITQPGNAHIDPVGAAVGITSAFLLAITNFLIRSLAKTEDALAMVFYFAVFSALLSVGFLPFFGTAHTTQHWLLLGGVGLCGTIGQWLLTLSLRYGAVASLVVMDYTTLVWATLYGWLIWDRLPVQATWIGAPIIVLAGLIITLREHRLARNARSEPVHGSDASA